MGNRNVLGCRRFVQPQHAQLMLSKLPLVQLRVGGSMCPGPVGALSALDAVGSGVGETV